MVQKKETTDNVVENKENDSIKAETPDKVSYIHVDTFLKSVRYIYPDISYMQIAGFKGYMQGRQYMTSMESFKDELDKYLGK